MTINKIYIKKDSHILPSYFYEYRKLRLISPPILSWRSINISKFHFDHESEVDEEPLCGCATSKSLLLLLSSHNVCLESLGPGSNHDPGALGDSQFLD